MWIEAALLAAPFAAVLALWDRLPARIPLHWNLGGEPDRWSSSRWEVLLLPLLGVAAVILCHVLPRLDPKLRATSESGRMPMALQILRMAFACFFGAIFIVQLAIAFDWPLPTARLVVASVLLLFAVTGNYLGNLRQNYFFGIRTPWTLQDFETWRVTHRRGGRLMFFGSSTLLLLQFLVRDRLFVCLLLTAALGFILWCFLYSWHDFRSRRNASHVS